MARLSATTFLLMVSLAVVTAVHAGLSNSVHNLTASGPGPIREPNTEQLCVFCHTPHNANPQQALWNRDLPGTVYTLYDSSTLEAQLNQPTGASRLCLSCHDGTVALGNLRVPPRDGAATLGPLTGASALGSDLSDDHPVSFVYNSQLATQHGELADPSMLPVKVRTDQFGQLQCTACHDPHDDTYRAFLHLDDRAGAMCTACHVIHDWPPSRHATSPAIWSGNGTNPWPDSPYSTVTDNACQNCHQPHSAAHPSRLLRDIDEAQVCLVCHNGEVATDNLVPEFAKASAHPIFSTNWTHEPNENPDTMPRHVTCVDCHNPHAATDTSVPPPDVPGPLKGVPGLSITGLPVAESTYEYEVCLKCHGVQDQLTPLAIVRQDNTRNVRLEIDQTNPSYHPIAAVGANPNMGGLQAGYTVNSIIGCTDCHNNNQWGPTAPYPRGPHGAYFYPILERGYEMNDPSIESFPSYAICYKCHNRTYLIGNQANTFPHNTHLITHQASCAACHDAHGSRQHPYLINFMLTDANGVTVVSPSSGGRLEFNSTGLGSGECYLSCHGADHNPRSYP